LAARPTIPTQLVVSIVVVHLRSVSISFSVPPQLPLCSTPLNSARIHFPADKIGQFWHSGKRDLSWPPLWTKEKLAQIAQAVVIKTLAPIPSTRLAVQQVSRIQSDSNEQRRWANLNLDATRCTPTSTTYELGLFRLTRLQSSVPC
jgi:hypothetical protein